MSKLSINDSTLTAIGDAIRAKTGKSALIAPGDMPNEIASITTGGGGGDIPEEALTITGDCRYRFANGGWDWFINEYGSRLTTKDITNVAYMFMGCGASNIPFDINIKDGGCDCTQMFSQSKLVVIPAIDFKQTSNYRDCGYLFSTSNDVASIGTISNLWPSGVSYMFSACCCLRSLPKFENFNTSRLRAYNYASANNLLNNCYSLRSVDCDTLDLFRNDKNTSSYSSFYYNLFNGCYALDSIIDLPVFGTFTSNSFNQTFHNCSHINKMTFKMNDGQAQTIQWKSQVLDLTTYVGYYYHSYVFYDYNSGITADKEVKDDATYQALKNDPDWFTTKVEYSRYNHDSAVETINSLPDTSAYGTNTIKFKGASGSATDGGAINTLTEEEIAVATAKGWTVTLA